MLVSERTWTDKRDGRTWVVRGVWLSDQLVMGPVDFGCGKLIYHCWCGVTMTSDREMAELLDGARRAHPAGR